MSAIIETSASKRKEDRAGHQKSGKASKQLDQQKNPCIKEQEMSFKCLDESGYDPDKCSKHFQNYRNCREFWRLVVFDRKRKGIIPYLPPPEERNMEHSWNEKDYRSISQQEKRQNPFSKELMEQKLKLDKHGIYSNSDASGNVNSPEDCKASSANDKSFIGGWNESLSFADIVNFIQKGMPLPGAINLEVAASDQPPTPSILTRTKKPWEQ